MAQLSFNANEVNDDLLPAGEYVCQIIQSEMKNNAAGTGEYLELRVQVLDEDYQGMLIFERLNLVHPNKQAERIASRTLRDICMACGVIELEDTESLHEIEFIAKVAIQESKNDYPPSNVVKKYLPK